MTTTSRSAKYAKWLSIPLGLAISALLIWQASYAAFSAQISEEGSLTAGTVTINEGTNLVGSFAAENLAPGADWRVQTIEATYTGSLSADVSFYAEGLEATKTHLADAIDLEITAVAHGPDGTPVAGNPEPFFTGTLAQFAARHHSFESGWRSPVPVSKGYGADLNIAYRLSEHVSDNELQGATATLTFVGEARSIPKNG